jgi:hypothetical protein
MAKLKNTMFPYDCHYLSAKALATVEQIPKGNQHEAPA